MQLTNPNWVNHDGGAIYSIDLHPSGTKLVTCGQGNIGGSGLVIVWNLGPIKHEKQHADSSIPKMLAKIDHQAGVNCVRWSPDGCFLCCGSDDKIVTVYEYGGRVKSSGSIGKNDVLTVEKYRTAHTLHLHSMEVLSVEWSPDGRYLASASMDNTIAIWNARKMPERIILLDSARGGHDGPVKGLSWDPIGKYLASQSADKTVRLWKTDDWKCCNVIKKPFLESGQTTMFSRLSWAADGQYLFAPCAMNNQGPVAQVIQRRDWDTSLDIVGHRKAITSVRACPRLLHYKDQRGKKLEVSVLAVGSRDKSVSVWVFPLVKRPIVVMNRVFKHSIMDLTWNGLDLAVASQDGTVKFVSFSEKELGTFLTDEEMAARCQKLYEQCPPQFLNGAMGMNDREEEDYDRDLDMDISLLEATSDGKEKGKAKASSVRPSDAAKAAAAAAVAKKKAEILKKDRKEQVEVRAKDGKRRIQPVFVSSVRDEEEGSAPSTSSAAPAPAPKIKSKKEAVKKVAAAPSPATKKRRVEVSTDDSTAPESSDEEEMETDGNSVGGKERRDRQTAAEMAETKRKEDMMRAEFKRPALRPTETTHIAVTDASTVLDVPEQKEALSEPVLGVLNASLEVNNIWAVGNVRNSRVVYMQGGRPLWTAYVGPPVSIAVANRLWTMIGGFDRSLRVYSSENGRLQCAIQLDSAPVRLGLNGNKMYALTQTGRFSSWDVNKLTCILSRQPISDCVSIDSNLTSINLTAAGMPVLCFSTGKIFTYSPDLQSWHLVDSASTVLRLCDDLDGNEFGDGQLGRLFRRRKRVAALPNVPAAIRSVVKENEMEAWLVSAQMTGSSNDYRRILISYTQQLIKHRSVSKLKYLLSQLTNQPVICNLKSAALKKDVEDLIRADPATATILDPTRNGAVF